MGVERVGAIIPTGELSTIGEIHVVLPSPRPAEGQHGGERTEAVTLWEPVTTLKMLV